MTKQEAIDKAKSYLETTLYTGLPYEGEMSVISVSKYTGAEKTFITLRYIADSSAKEIVIHIPH